MSYHLSDVMMTGYRRSKLVKYGYAMNVYQRVRTRRYGQSRFPGSKVGCYSAFAKAHELPGKRVESPSLNSVTCFVTQRIVSV